MQVHSQPSAVSRQPISEAFPPTDRRLENGTSPLTQRLATPQDLAALQASGARSLDEQAQLDAVKADFQQQFAQAAQDPAKFHVLMQSTFGPQYNREQAEQLRQSALAGDFSWMPEVKLVDGATLADQSGNQGAGTANGAYSQSENTIYLNRDLLSDPAQARRTLNEEMGHAIDARVNTTDARGDEGQLFSLSLSGADISPEQRAAILNDNDHGTVNINGKSVEVEYDFWKKAKNEARRAESNVRNEAARTESNIRNHVVNPSLDFAQAGLNIVEDAVKFHFEFFADAHKGLERTLRGTWNHGLDGGWRAARHSFEELGSLTLHQLADTAIYTAAAGVDFVEGVLGTQTERGLTQEEIALLKPIYGNSIDYSKVKIHTGGIRDQAMDHPMVIGNDIWFPKGFFGPDGKPVNAEAQAEFIHEFGHIWQYQNHGPDYLSEALEAGGFGDDSSHQTIGTGKSGYDWLSLADKGQNFENMNPEAQAELAKYIGMSIGSDGKVDREALNDYITKHMPPGTAPEGGYKMSDATWQTVQHAHSVLSGKQY